MYLSFRTSIVQLTNYDFKTRKHEEFLLQQSITFYSTICFREISTQFSSQFRNPFTIFHVSSETLPRSSSRYILRRSAMLWFSKVLHAMLIAYLLHVVSLFAFPSGSSFIHADQNQPSSYRLFLCQVFTRYFQKALPPSNTFVHPIDRPVPSWCRSLNLRIHTMDTFFPPSIPDVGLFPATWTTTTHQHSAIVSLHHEFSNSSIHDDHDQSSPCFF